MTRSGKAGRRLIRGQIAWYAGALPLYANLLRDSGYRENVDRVATLWQAGDHDGAARAVSDELVAGVGVVGDLDECRERIEEYRAAGLKRPVLYPMPLDSSQTKSVFLATVEILES